MKIIVLLSASVLGFGLAVKDVTSVEATKAATIEQAQKAVELEKPAAHVLLDTVEITAVAPSAVALK